MAVKVGQLVARNWPIKMAALFFAVMLYIAVAAQQRLTQTFAVRLAVTLPPGRSLRQAPPVVAVAISGKGGEILKLRSFPRTIAKTVPETLSTTVWHVHLQPSDVPLPKGTDLEVADMTPRDLDVVLDSVAAKDVRVVPLVSLDPDTGYVIQAIASSPGTVRLVAPPKSLAGVESVTTVLTTLPGVAAPFIKTVAIDTTPLGVVRLAPKDVRIFGDVAAWAERTFTGVPVTAVASGLVGWQLVTEQVSVKLGGPAPTVSALTRDSVKVIAHLVSPSGPGGYARLSVTAPPGVRARAVLDSVGLKRQA